MQHFYMVEFEIHGVMTPEFFELIPAQRELVNELMAKGQIRCYSLSENRTRLWMVVIAKNDFEVLQLIGDMPLSDFMIPSISPLMFHHSMDAIMAMSLN